MDAIKSMFDCYTEDTGSVPTTPNGDAEITADKISEMIDSATEQFKNSALNNKSEIETLKESIDTLTEKINDISAKLEKSSDNIDTTNTADTPQE